MLSFESISTNPLIRLTDANEDLKLFSYTECSETSPEEVKRCRGAVFDTGNNLISTSFPFSVEIADSETEKIQSLLAPIFNSCSFYHSYEGCLIRMFNYGGKWYISTTKKLDAFKSKWACRKSFGDLFIEAVDRAHHRHLLLKAIMKIPCPEEELALKTVTIEWLTSHLDKDKQYMFLLQNNMENRVMCQYKTPKVYHVATFGINQEPVSLETPLPIPFHQEEKFNSIEDLISFVRSSDPLLLQGIVVFAPGNVQYKILSSAYLETALLRNNEPSIKFRYLQLRMNLDQNKQFRDLYPEFEADFEEYENLIFDASTFIYNSYVNRYIKGLFVSVPQEEFGIMRQAHEWYQKDMKYNRINYSVIMNLLNKATPTILNRIIKHIKFGVEEKKTKPETKRLLEVNIA